MENQVPKKQRVRSPAYPMISLEEAIEKVKILWEKEQKNPFPKEAAVHDLGYSSYGGYSGRIISALKQFNLISEEKNNIILTKWGIDLSLHNPSDDNYKDIIKEICIYPIIYSKLYNEYNGILPSDATLRIKLIKEYNFNTTKIDGFLLDFRKTLAFAGLLDKKDDSEGEKNNNAIIQSRDPDKQATDQKKGQIMTEQQQFNITHEGQSFPIPFLGGNKVTLIFDKLPIQKKELEKIKKWVDLFEDSLTEEVEVKQESVED